MGPGPHGTYLWCRAFDGGHQKSQSAQGDATVHILIRHGHSRWKIFRKLCIQSGPIQTPIYLPFPSGKPYKRGLRQVVYFLAPLHDHWREIKGPTRTMDTSNTQEMDMVLLLNQWTTTSQRRHSIPLSSCAVNAMDTLWNGICFGPEWTTGDKLCARSSGVSPGAWHISGIQTFYRPKYGQPLKKPNLIYFGF